MIKLTNEILNNEATIIEKQKIDLEEICISHFYNDVIKRTFDCITALILFVIISPVIVVTIILIRIDSNGPVFYRALRGGYHDIPFKIYKFRSMVINADKIGGPTTGLNDKRITKIGMFLRKTKLDETPQLINIIKGEMSFIGPRPEVLQYTELYNEQEKNILEVRPGITDISSLKFISLDEAVGEENADENYEKYILGHKNELRLKYVKEQSFILDAKLFIKTVLRTIKKIIKVILKVG